MKRLHWHSLRTLFARLPAFDSESVPDGELLERYHRGDSAAFELLVHQHAETVFGTCTRICRDSHDAEDAFQATFLVLARKAKGIRRSKCIAGWLHRVAHRASTRAAVKRSKSQQRELSIAVEPPSVHSESSDLQSILDAEINRLTDRFRLPILLCYLQGLSTEDAAKQLGIPRGTVLSRLATARQKLTTRLTRRGITVPTTAIGLFGFGTGQTVSASLVSTAAQSMTLPSTSTSAGLLAKEILRMTAWKTSTTWATAFVAITGLGGTVWAVAAGGKDGPPAVAKAPEKAKLNEPVKAEKPIPTEQPKPEAPRAESDKREKEAAEKAEAEKKVKIERSMQIERLSQIVEDFEKRSLNYRLEYAKLMASAGLPEYDPKVLSEAISKIDAERIAAEDEKEQGKEEAEAKLTRLNHRRDILSGRLLKQEAVLSDRNYRLEILKREMIRLERLGDDLRTQLIYLHNGLAPPNSSSIDPAIQKLVEEVTELKLEMRKLSEAKK